MSVLKVSTNQAYSRVVLRVSFIRWKRTSVCSSSQILFKLCVSVLDIWS